MKEFARFCFLIEAALWCKKGLYYARQTADGSGGSIETWKKHKAIDRYTGKDQTGRG